jgi:hypothetical protein
VEAPTSNLPSSPQSATKRAVRKAESTDAVATFLTRRFGLAGGLAWLGFLAIGTLGEQIKTRLEVANEEAGTKEVTLHKCGTPSYSIPMESACCGG